MLIASFEVNIRLPSIHISRGIRMIQFFINRAGKNLSPARKRELERAKELLQAKKAKAE